MGVTTGISWTDSTINFWHGCHKVSEGCRYCYMYRDKARWKKDGNIVLKTQPGTVNSILQKLRTQFRLTGERIKVFTCSYSDFFIEEADPWRKEAWDLIRENDFIDWQILTKRIDRAKACLPDDWGEGWDHVWLGVSAENQGRWDERVPVLVNTPAKIRFVSAEPLLGYIDIVSPLIDWVIIGGESGNEHGPWKYRPVSIEAISNLVDQCKEANIPVFVKQLGTHLAKLFHCKSRSGDDPEEWGGFLLDIKFQQFPKIIIHGFS